ncbi:MAG: TonB-dependent receptor plug domain-containing protein [Myxococcota bacterium]|nr:TonB-dependent receptor plug domain-containing protein [Myxococcota bacterium]
MNRACIALLVLVPASAMADDDDDDPPPRSVTSTTLTREQLERRPHRRTTDLLRHLPELTTLSQGGGAEQFLLRGSAESGTVYVVVDGVPITLGSHAFAHGYADTHFVMPDTVERIALHAGAYAARYGSSAVAGTLEITTLDEVPGGARVSLTSGLHLAHDIAGQKQLIIERAKRLNYQLQGMFSPELERSKALLAVEVGVDDGPSIHPDRFRRGLVLGKWSRDLGDGTVRAMAQFYTGRWFDSGHLPLASVEAGRLQPYSAADATQGGSALRSSASVVYETTSKKGATWHFGIYGVDSDLRLYTNTSLFRDDPVSGDQIEYVDTRSYYGLDAYWRRPHRIGPVHGSLRLGVQARADAITTTTWHDARRLRLASCGLAVNPCTDTAPRTRVTSVYAEDTWRWRRLRAQTGLRLDQEMWNVDDRDADTMLGATTLGGTGARSRITPRAVLAYVHDALEVAVAGNLGSIGTDARASVDRTGYGAFVRTRGAEAGARVHTDTLDAALAWWWLQIDEHQLWIAAEGRGVRADRVNRTGLSATLAATLRPWLRFDAALAIARASTRPDEGPHVDVPQSPRLAANGGLSVSRGASYASARVRVLGQRVTADPARDAAGHHLIDLVGGTRWRAFALTLTVENILDTRWRESQFATLVRTGRAVDITQDLMVAHGIPFTASITLAYAPR